MNNKYKLKHMENKKLIDFITYELEQIHGELIIQDVFSNEIDDKFMDIANKYPPNTDFTSILAEINNYQELGQKRYDLTNRLEYLKGMMEAYSKIMAQIKKDEE